MCRRQRITLRSETKPLPLFEGRRWVFAFLTSVILMCVKYNDDSCWKKNLFHSLEEGVGSWCVAKLVQASKRHSLTLLMNTMTKRSWTSKRNSDYNDNHNDTTQWKQKLLPVIIGANKRNRNCVRLEHHEQLVSVANTWVLIYSGLIKNNEDNRIE